MLKIAEKYLKNSLENEKDPDKIKVLNDKIIKLNAEIQKNIKKRNMMKGFIDKKI